MNEFARKNSITEVLNTNTPIHNDLTMFYLMLVEELKKYSSDDYDALSRQRSEIINEKQLFRISVINVIEKGIKREKNNLLNLGFRNAKSERMQRYEEKLSTAERKLSDLTAVQRNVEARIDNIENQQITKEILLRLKKDFGEEALFVRYDDFEKVINKYNLVCGRISDYNGVLPEYKMADINRVLTMDIPKFWEDKISRLCSAYDILDNQTKTNFPRRFPFFTRDNLPYGRRLMTRPCRFFIVAPAHEMLTEKELWEKAERERKARAKDPFICAHTRWGIIIFTKWGEESEDEIIKKYKR